MDNIQYKNRNSGKAKKWVGIVFLILGVIMLSKTLGVYIPGWITSWPMWLIAIGVFTGAKRDFRDPSSYILIIIGVIFLADKVIPNMDVHDFLWPIGIMALGLYMIIGKKKITNWGNESAPSTDNLSWDKRVGPDNEPIAQGTSVDDYFDIVSIFGGVKKNIVSKNFLGGEIVAIMGGAEINLSQADIVSPRVELELTQIFGGTKIIIPPHWKVSSDLVAVFGGIEDKRPFMSNVTLSEEKHLIIKGTSIFGGIDIRSF